MSVKYKADYAVLQRQAISALLNGLLQTETDKISISY